MYNDWEQKIFTELGQLKGKECGKLITEGLDELQYLSKSGVNATAVNPELESLFHSGCKKAKNEQNLAAAINGVIWSEIWETPARNQFHDTNSFGTVIPKEPVYKFCQSFKDIPANPEYKQKAML